MSGNEIKITSTEVWYMPDVDYPPYDVVAYAHSAILGRVLGPYHLDLYFDKSLAEAAAREVVGTKIDWVDAITTQLGYKEEVLARFQ